MNYQSKSFKLYHHEMLIGIISSIGSDWPLWIGHIELTPAFEVYRKDFQLLTDEENPNQFDNLTEDQMKNWFLEDSDGNKEHIYIPAIHEDDNSVCWRWGDPDEMEALSE